jgi:hypothetical protein
MARNRLVLIKRDDLLPVGDDDLEVRLIRLLARLSRHGYHLLLTADQPSDWAERAIYRRSHGKRRGLRQRLAEAGGVMDGIYYVPRSLITQKRSRVEALKDMLDRFSVRPDDCFLYSSNAKFVSVAGEIGIKSSVINNKSQLLKLIEGLDLGQSDGGNP